MKKIFPIVLCLLLLPFSSARADFMVRIEEHRDGHYHHGSMEPAEDSEGEIWFGDSMVSILHDDRRYIIDTDAEKMIIVELKDSIYVETSLPLNLASVVPEEQARRLAMFPTVGEVKKTGETRRIGGRECSGYMVNTWVMYQGNRYNQRESRVWVTTDIPVDARLLRAFNRNMIALRNMGEEMASSLMEVEGLNMLSETVEYSEGAEINSSAKVIECGEMEPGRGVYSVPEGFNKQERLSPGRR
ncbi:MAG: hypothetical protein GF417_04705 [Candidatus Latescibacteria bacterium]|nr:hypothetical protein [bacterium]MBD3423721.1 hypothetical protein [Candidatus Latescibacterota bacterium]